MKKFKNIRLMLVGLFCLMGMNAFADDFVYANNLVYKVVSAEDKTVYFYGLSEKFTVEDWSTYTLTVPGTITTTAPGTGATTTYTVIGFEGSSWNEARGTGDEKTQTWYNKIERLEFNFSLKTDAARTEAMKPIKFDVYTALKYFKLGDCRMTATLPALNPALKATLEELDLAGVSNDKDPVAVPANFAKNFTALKKVSLPNVDEVTVGDNAFALDQNLATIINFDKITTIGEKAFQGIAVENLTIPAGVTSIGSGAFWSISKTKKIYFNSNEMTTIPAVFSDLTVLEEIHVTSTSVTSIAKNAFADATKVKKIILDAPITSIGADAFANLSTLEEVDLEDTELKSLANIPVPTNSKANLKKFLFSATLEGTIPSFEDCAKLETINAIPAKVSGITSFKNCVKLASIDLSGTQVKSIPDNAFQMTEQLTGDKQFVNGIQQFNTALATVTLNAETTSIGDHAFDGCSKLATINLKGLTKLNNIGEWAFFRTIIDEVDLTAAADKNSDGSYKFTEIKKGAFANITALTTVKLAPGIKKIGAGAFAFTGLDKKGESLGKLTTVDGLNTTVIEEIGEGAFLGAAWTELTLTGATNKKFTEIPTLAFGLNKNLKTVALPVQIDEIGAQAFANAIALSSINLNQTCITVLPNIFTTDKNPNEVSLDNLKKIELVKDPEVTTADGDPLPELEVIGEYAFQFTGLTDVVIPESVWSFGEDLKAIPADEYSDGDTDNGRVFQGCVNLKTFEWKNAQVSTMPFYTFRGDVKLTDVTFLTTATADPIYDEIFFMCNNVNVNVTRDSYNKTVAEGYGNENRKYSTLLIANNKVFEFTEKNFNAADEYYYATYYNEDNSSWFDATKFDVYAAVVEGAKVVLSPATVDGGYYKVPVLYAGVNDAKAICVIRSKDIKAVPELNSNPGSEDISTLPAVNHLQYADGSTDKGSKINYVFKLGRKDNKIAFYRITSGVFKAGTVFIDAEDTARGYDALDLVIGGESTGINAVKENVEIDNAPVYNLQGVRVNATKKGMYIKDGKKFMVK